MNSNAKITFMILKKHCLFSNIWENYLRLFTISEYRYNYLAKVLLFSRKSYDKILENILKFYDGGPGAWSERKEGFLALMQNADDNLDLFDFRYESSHEFTINRFFFLSILQWKQIKWSHNHFKTETIDHIRR